MPRPIAAPTPLPACAGVGVVKDSAAIAPASATPLPICPKRLNTVWFVLMALSIFCNFKFDTLDVGLLRRTATSESPRQSFHKFPLCSGAVRARWPPVIRCRDRLRSAPAVGAFLGTAGNRPLDRDPVRQHNPAGQVEFSGLALDQQDPLAFDAALGATAADAQRADAGVLDFGDNPFELELARDLEAEADRLPLADHNQEARPQDRLDPVIDHWQTDCLLRLVLRRIGAVEERLVIFPGGRENVGQADIERLFDLLRDLSGETGPIETTRIEETRP